MIDLCLYLNFNSICVRASCVNVNKVLFHNSSVSIIFCTFEVVSSFTANVEFILPPQKSEPPPPSSPFPQPVPADALRVPAFSLRVCTDWLRVRRFHFPYRAFPCPVFCLCAPSVRQVILPFRQPQSTSWQIAPRVVNRYCISSGCKKIKRIHQL